MVSFGSSSQSRNILSRLSRMFKYPLHTCFNIVLFYWRFDKGDTWFKSTWSLCFKWFSEPRVFRFWHAHPLHFFFTFLHILQSAGNSCKTNAFSTVFLYQCMGITSCKWWSRSVRAFGCMCTRRWWFLPICYSTTHVTLVIGAWFVRSQPSAPITIRNICIKRKIEVSWVWYICYIHLDRNQGPGSEGAK